MFCGLFVLMFSKSAYLVYLGGTGGPNKPILMYYHLKTQYSKVFLKTLLHHFDVLRLRIYGFFDRNLLPCSQQRFSYVYVLTAHLQMHSGLKSHKCTQCEFASVYANALNKHLIIHSREKLNICNECDNASSSVSKLRKHF